MLLDVYIYIGLRWCMTTVTKIFIIIVQKKVAIIKSRNNHSNLEGRLQVSYSVMCLVNAPRICRRFFKKTISKQKQ